MNRYKRKVRKFENDLGLTLPVDLLKKVGLNQGDAVEITEKDGEIILHKKEGVKLPEDLDADFIKILNETNDAHGEALKKLVDRRLKRLAFVLKVLTDSQPKNF